MRPLLLIFVKNPVPGKVKTRLAKDVGDQRAMELYMLLLQHTREVTLGVDASRAVFYTDFVDENDLWPADRYLKALQIEGGLGEKMHNAFLRGFAQGYGPILIVGSDCAELRSHHVEEAFKALETHDFVIGPAKDGGYYLLGMNQPEESLFLNKEWSTESVYSDTLKDIAALEKSVYALPELSDTDFVADLEPLKELYPEHFS